MICCLIEGRAGFDVHTPPITSPAIEVKKNSQKVKNIEEDSWRVVATNKLQANVASMPRPAKMKFWRK